MASKPKGLGRGLSALMADVDIATPKEAASAPKPEMILPIDLIRPNPDQPRRIFGEEPLSELANSIKEKGVIQPLIVRPDPDREGAYQIVAGERRWRAAQRANLHELPVLVRELTDTETLEIAIIENIQRADLNAIDEAAGYDQLMSRFGHTQEQLATALGKSRSHIANLLRLLTLSQPVRQLVSEGKLSAGHARTLVGRDDAEGLAQQIISKGLSVREAEALTRSPKATGARGMRPKQTKDADTRLIEGDLSAHLKMRVSIDPDPSGEGGTLSLRYQSLDQLDDLLRVLSGG